MTLFLHLSLADLPRLTIVLFLSFLVLPGFLSQWFSEDVEPNNDTHSFLDGLKVKCSVDCLFEDLRVYDFASRQAVGLELLASSCGGSLCEDLKAYNLVLL